MNMRHSRESNFSTMRCGRTLIAAMLFAAGAQAGAQTDISTAPISSLTGATTKVGPNVMVIVDDSTSMDYFWMPDNLRGSKDIGFHFMCRQFFSPKIQLPVPPLNPKPPPTPAAGTAAAFYYADKLSYYYNNDITAYYYSDDASCNVGDPPLSAYQVNSIYFNPNSANSYQPPIDADGSNTTYSSYDNSGPASRSWSKVKISAYDTTSTNTIDLLHEFPETVYCDSAAPNATCRQNGKDATNYDTTDQAAGALGQSGFPDGNRALGIPATYYYPQTRYGGPYYYTMTPIEYCKDAALRQCGSTSKTGAYQYEAYVRYCNTAKAVNKPAGAVAEWNYQVGVAPPSDVCQSTYSNGGFGRARYGKFSRVDIDSADSVTMTKFANWYAYYRTRNSTMKASLGFAFQPLDPSYRVGYMGTDYERIVGTNAQSRKILPAFPFSGTSKSDWFRKAYGHPYRSGNTNIASPLSAGGRYFAGKLVGRTYLSPAVPWTNSTPQLPINDPGDPAFSCRANIAIVATDGAWNDNAGAFALDGVSSVGDQDAVLARPYYEGPIPTTDTAADVAQYYWSSHLRSWPKENVRPSALDPATYQHMEVFTIGFGVGGTLTYVPNYLTYFNSDYQQILNGTRDWPVPAPLAPSAVDDLWHTAANGHGLYFAARDPKSFSDAITTIFASATNPGEEVGAGATTSTLNFIADNTYGFLTKFNNGDWSGDVTKVAIDAASGSVGATQWTVGGLLDLASAGNAYLTRNIYTSDSSGSRVLFAWNSLTVSEQNNYFLPSKLSHYAGLSATQKTALPDGQKLFDFVRGQRIFEAANNDTTNQDLAPNALLRHRGHVLGDIASSRAAYVAAPDRTYADQGYAAFAASNLRTPTVYVGANDGMLHAFDAVTGSERWAYVPRMLLPKLYRLADKAYTHQFYVDGSPVVEDICSANCGSASAAWKTILVAGLNAGGRGFFALDITGDTPWVLWEIQAGSICLPVGTVAPGNRTDCDIGYSFGNPVVTKRADGKWVVLFTSGYNNGNSETPTGSGRGYLYVADAASGEILNKIPTGVVGVPTDPSGLAKISAWVDKPAVDNTALRVYGGDLKGNLWRFEANATHTFPASGVAAYPLAQFIQMPEGVRQPITTKPELGLLNSNVMVYVGTGQLLAQSDFYTTQQQSFYGIKDDLGAGGYGAVRSPGVLVQQSLSMVGGKRVVSSPAPVNLASGKGWYFDFNPGGDSPGERLHTDPILNFGTLTFSTYDPPKDPCADATGGTSFLYSVSALNGNAQSTNILAGLSTDSAVGMTTNGKIVSLTGYSDGGLNPTKWSNDTVADMGQAISGRRVSWREILTK